MGGCLSDIKKKGEIKRAHSIANKKSATAEPNNHEPQA